MENQPSSNKKESRNEVTKKESFSVDKPQPSIVEKEDSNLLDKTKPNSESKVELSPTPKKPVKPPKLEDKPFEEFISKH